MRQLGLTIPLFQSHGFGNRQYIAQAGMAAEGILCPASRLLVVEALPESHPQKKILAGYKKDYESLYKEDVSAFGGYAYDAILILREALKKAGTPDRDKVRDAVESLRGLVGITGAFSFSSQDHTGLDLSAFEMLVVKDGKFTISAK